MSKIEVLEPLFHICSHRKGGQIPAVACRRINWTRELWTQVLTTLQSFRVNLYFSTSLHSQSYSSYMWCECKFCCPTGQFHMLNLQWCLQWFTRTWTPFKSTLPGNISLFTCWCQFMMNGITQAQYHSSSQWKGLTLFPGSTTLSATQANNVSADSGVMSSSLNTYEVL